jgi:hypothetical protein
VVRRDLVAVPVVALAGGVLPGVGVVAGLLRYAVTEGRGQATAPLPLGLVRLGRPVGGGVGGAHAQTPKIGFSSGSVVSDGVGGAGVSEAVGVSDGVSEGVSLGVSDGVPVGLSPAVGVSVDPGGPSALTDVPPISFGGRTLSSASSFQISSASGSQ